MELEIQKFLRNTPNGIEKLKELYSIDCKRHSGYNQLCLFKYSQIESDFKEPIVQEARGIILDEKDNWKVICYTFRKFFNYGEPLAAKIDWSTAEVQAKEDGSLCQLYYYDDDWHVATSGTPDASGQVGDYGKTFEELFWKTWEKQGCKTEWLGTDFSYAFELTGPLNRVVVDHKEASLHLIGGRNKNTLKEVSVSLQPEAFNSVKVYPLNSIEDCIKAAEGLNPLEHEGFVVVDSHFNRVKIKSPAYVMLHHAKDSLSKKRMCEVIRKGEYSELKIAISSFPTLLDIFEEIQQKHVDTVETIGKTYNSIKDRISQKEFASVATAYPYSSILFQMRKTGASVTQALSSAKITTDSYMRIVGCV
jgi:hypothetical protein